MDFQKEMLTEYDREAERTRKMLDAIPVDADMNFKPHPKSMSLGQLAGHVTNTAGEWASTTLATDKLQFAADHKFEPYIPASKAALLEKFDKDVAKAKKDLAEFPISKWSDHWKFIFGDTTWIDQPKIQVWREVVMNHLIHHRAQLSVYIRLLNQKVPGLYGPSADEM